MKTKNDIQIFEWIEKLQAQGRYAFSVEKLKPELKDLKIVTDMR